MFKRFRSVNGTITVSNTLGFTSVIGTEFVDVHQSLWKAAYSEGAISEEALQIARDYVTEKKKEQKDQEAIERAEIKELMKKEILDNPAQYLDKDDSLIYRKVVALVKKTYKKEYFDTIWKEIVSEAG